MRLKTYFLSLAILPIWIHLLQNNMQEDHPLTTTFLVWWLLVPVWFTKGNSISRESWDKIVLRIPHTSFFGGSKNTRILTLKSRVLASLFNFSISSLVCSFFFWFIFWYPCKNYFLPKVDLIINHCIGKSQYENIQVLYSSSFSNIIFMNCNGILKPLICCLLFWANVINVL